MRLELVCLAIVAAYVALRLRSGERRAFLVRFSLLALAGFIGEDTIIRVYGAYAYASTWSVHLDRVPLVIVLVWPVVIDSARSLARVLVKPSPLRVALVAAAIVLADASLIEPIAVRAGLWRWTDPGLFGVPLVGIAGWAFFSGACVFVLERTRAMLVVVVAPIATHALVLATWWIVFRWIQGPLPDAAAPIVVWIACTSLAVLARRANVTRTLLLSRLPGALFFFALLGCTLAAPWPFAAPDLATYAAPPARALLLLVYAAAFAPPYLVLLLQTRGITLQVANRKSPTESV
jgi:hypothetical protein